MVSCLVISLLLAGCGKKQPEAEEKEQITPVQTAVVAKGVLSDITVVTGKLEALASSNVVPGGAGGKVQSVNVALGDKVARGQTLVMLEQAVQEATIRQAQQGVAQARSALEVSKINFEQAAANYERGKELLAFGAIPQAGPTGFETAYEMPYKQARIDYEQLKPAALATAQAALDMAREQYNNTFINAPISGVVTAVNINPGEFASPGSPVPLVSVVNLDQVVVKAAVAENVINKVKKGQEVPVLISAVSAEPWTGVVTNIAPAADSTSKAYPIKIQINNPKHLLKPGMFAEVQLRGEQPETLLVPREAVIKLDGKDTVWVVQDNLVTSRPVTVGLSDGEKIQIADGLKEGEQIVIVGQGNLQEKTRVEIIDAPAENTDTKDSENGKDNKENKDGENAKDNKDTEAKNENIKGADPQKTAGLGSATKDKQAQRAGTGSKISVAHGSAVAPAIGKQVV